MFSLAVSSSPEETQYGYSWVDGHLPGQSDEPASLMSDAEIKRCAQAAIEGGCNYLGAKMCVPKDASLEERLAMLTNFYMAWYFILLLASELFYFFWWGWSGGAAQPPLFV